MPRGERQVIVSGPEKVEAIGPVVNEGWRSVFWIGTREDVLQFVTYIASEQETCIAKNANNIKLADRPAYQSTQQKERK